MKQRKTPMRMCVGCREMKPKKELLRIVRSPQGEISIDQTGRKAGRGAYVCRNEACMTRAVKQKQLEHAFETPVSDDIKQLLIEQARALAGS